MCKVGGVQLGEAVKGVAGVDIGEGQAVLAHQVQQVRESSGAARKVKRAFISTDSTACDLIPPSILMFIMCLGLPFPEFVQTQLTLLSVMW